MLGTRETLMGDHPPLAQRWWLLLAAVFQVGAIIWQASSAAGADLSGRAATEAPIIPAGYTFAIWGPIYLGCTALAVWQALPAQQGHPLLRRVRLPLTAAFSFTGLWAVAAGLPAPAVTWGTVACIFPMFAALMVAWRRLPGDLRGADRWLMRGTVGLFLGYVTLATVANTSATLWELGIRSLLGLSPQGWATLMSVVAGLLAAGLTTLGKGRSPYALAAAWGLVGVGVANVGTPTLPAAFIMAGLVLAVWLWSRRDSTALAPR